MLIPYLPYPPQSGGQTRSFNLIKHLSQSTDITLFSFIRSPVEKRQITHLKKYCRKILTFDRGPTWSARKILFTGFSPYAFLMSNYFSSTLKEEIRKELDENHYDLIHAECFYLMPNLPKTKVPILLVDQTIEYAVYQHYVQESKGLKRLLKPLLWIDVLKLKHWENHYWKQAYMVAGVSAEDHRLISDSSQRSDVEIVPNGVSDHYFKKIDKPKSTYPSILFGVANYKWMQNTEAAQILLDKIWPHIQKKVPQARLFIIGRHAPELFGQYRSKNIIVKEAGRDGQKDDPQTYYSQSWLLLAPIKSGGGSRTKFFEAMACGLPIVTTTAGIEGINAKNGQEALVCKNNQELVNQALALIKNRPLAQKIGENARNLAQKQYDWKRSALHLAQIYKRLAQTRT